MIDPDLLSADLLQGKLLPGKLRLVPISKRHLGAGKAQLPCKAPRKQPAAWIHDIGRAVMNRPADRYRPVLPCLIQFVIGSIYRELRGAIRIVNRPSRLWHNRHSLSADAKIIHIERLLCGQQLSELGGIRTSVYSVLLQEAPHFLRIPPCALRHDAYGSSHGQRREKVLHRRIEGKVRMKGDAALFTEPPPVPDKLHEIKECLMRYHDTLWFSGRA